MTTTKCVVSKIIIDKLSFKNKMKKIPLIIFLCLLFSNFLEAKKIEAQGYIISDENDTTKVTFEIPVDADLLPKYRKLQVGVNYRNAKGEKKELKPTTVKGIVFFLSGKAIKMLTCSDNLGVIKPPFSKQSEFFLRVISEEKIKVFLVDATVSLEMKSMDGLYFECDGYVYKKGNGELFMSGKCNVEYVFSDCQEVMNKINDGTFKKEYINPAVLEYNKVCGK
jgi:hypothetical protein